MLMMWNCLDIWKLQSNKFQTSWIVKSVFSTVISGVSGQKFSSIITHPKVLNSLTFVSTSLMIFYFYRILLWWLLKHDSTLFLPKIIKLFTICKGDRNRKLQNKFIKTFSGILCSSHLHLGITRRLNKLNLIVL